MVFAFFKFFFLFFCSVKVRRHAGSAAPLMQRKEPSPCMMDSEGLTIYEEDLTELRGRFATKASVYDFF